jgi:hypothetical protein
MAARKAGLRIVEERAESVANEPQKIAVFQAAATLKIHFESTY